jgi:hypothetical protein
MGKLEVKLPVFHTGQMQAFQRRTRYQVLRCGRRWGKTDYFKILAGDRVAKGQNVGIFVPNYKIQTEVYAELEESLLPIKRSSSKADWVQRYMTGGRIDFWTLENERAGRSRKYHLVLIDEAAFTKDSTMMKIWETCIAPTLLDYEGQAVVGSTPNGINEENFFYQVCMKPELGFSEYHAPTAQNPYMPFPLPHETRVQWQLRREAEFQKLKDRNHPLVYRQEYLAEFVDWSGVAFFELDKMLVNGEPAALPIMPDYVFAVLDTAVKDGAEHDGTAVTFYARNQHGIGAPLTILDWDIVQIQGASLETWLPTVYQQLQYWANITSARFGSGGVWIEDKMSGSILLQQAANHGWQAHPIDSKLTSLGKDARAINCSGQVYRGEVKLYQDAFNKKKLYKGFEKNHLISQVCGFTIGDKNAATRADDLLDTFTYGIAIALGNADGF